VTDDGNNYLQRATEFSHSHIYPDPSRNDKPEIKVSKKAAARNAAEEIAKQKMASRNSTISLAQKL